MDFDLYFAVDKLKISMSIMSLQMVYVGINIFIFPIIYMNLFKDYEYKILFMISQALYVVSHFVKYCLAVDWMQGYLVYFLAGTFAENIERCLVIIPSYIIMAKLIPKGVESSMMSLNTSIVAISQFAIRAWLGVLINDSFVNVTKENMKNYKYLCLIAALLAIVPLFFIWIMTPTIKECEDKQKGITEPE